jgi:hypothetical protein
MASSKSLSRARPTIFPTMIKLPQQNWLQLNNSDKFGSLAYTKNINLDEEGYIKLSPRMVKLMDGDIDDDLNLVTAIGKTSSGSWQAAASDKNWKVSLAATGRDLAEDSGTGAPTLTLDSHAVFFKGIWHASTDTAVLSKASPATAATWTSRITGLTTGKNHRLCVFQNRVSLCVANGNVVKQYDSNYANTIDLTIPTDYEIIGLAYNNNRLAVAARLSNDGTNGQDQEAKLFVWDGATTAANAGLSVGSDAVVDLIAYKSSFVILNRAGELLYFNGGGFDRLAAFPFYYMQDTYGDVFDLNALGYAPMVVDGDTILIHIGMELDAFNQKGERRHENTMSGVWCYDPKGGLYHKYAPSYSATYLNFVNGTTGINTTTNIFTVSAGGDALLTIPATGSIARLTDGTVEGLIENMDYYVIKLSSSTFKLATTKENALNGDAIDLTATGTNLYFWMYDLLDYGATYYNIPGAVALTRERTAVYTDVLVAGRLPNTANTNKNYLSVADPYLENRGYFVTPKMFSGEATDTFQKVFFKYRPLKTTDSIVVKYRTEEVLGLPTSSSGDAGTWTSPTEFYVAHDISEAKDYLDAGGSIECEIMAGAGAGQTVQVLSISTDDDATYSVVLEDDVLGAASSLRCEFILTNWTPARTITSADGDYNEVPIGKTGKFLQLKVEMRGSDIAIEELQIVNSTHEKAE